MVWGNPYDSSSFNISGYTTSGQNKFMAYTQGDNVMVDGQNGPMAIAVSIESYNQLKETTIKYRDRLKELVPEEMEPPLTTEQLNEKLMAELKDQKEAMQKLMNFVNELTAPRPEVKQQEVIADESRSNDVNDK